MLRFDIYLVHVGFPKPGRIPGQGRNLAMEIYDRYKDQEVRKRDCILSCWITIEAGATLIRGSAPKGWSPTDPVYENCHFDNTHLAA